MKNFFYFLTLTLVSTFSLPAIADLPNNKIEEKAPIYHFEKYDIDSVLPSHVISAIYADENGRFYVGLLKDYSENGGLGLFLGEKSNEKGRYNFKPKPIGLSDKIIKDIFVDSGGVIYVGTSVGLYIGKKTSNGQYEFEWQNLNYYWRWNSYLVNRVLSINGKIYVGTDKDGLFVREKNGSNTFTHHPFDNNQSLHTGYYIDQKEKVYVVTYNDDHDDANYLYIGEKNGNGNYVFTRSSTTIDQNKIFDIHFGPQENVYIGTNKGLFFSEKGGDFKNIRFNKENEDWNFWANLIFAVDTDTNGLVYVLARSDLLWGKKDGDQYIFTPLDISESHFLVNRFCLDAKNTLYITGSTPGLTSNFLLIGARE